MIGPLVLTIASVFKSAGLNQARQALTGASQDFNSFASSIGKAAGAFGAFQAIAGAREFVVGAVESANKFERNLLGLQQVFESATPALKNFITEVENYGLSQGRAAQASVFLGSVLKQYGLTTFEAGSQTQRLVTLAQDLATTYGYDVQEALLAITALFRGEYDPIEKFGVAMKQSEINAYLAAKGLNDLEGAELNLAQAQARLTLLYERSADAQGAFGRASDTLYASQQRLMAVVENLQIAFGQPLQGPIAQVLNLFTEVAKNAGPELLDVSTALSKVIEDLGPTLGRFAETLLQTIGLLQPVIELLNLFSNAIAFLLNPALDITNDTIKLLNQFFDTFSLRVSAASDELSRFMGLANDDALLKGANDLANQIGAEAVVGRFFKDLNDQLVRSEQTLRAASGDFASFENGAKRASVALRGSAYAARDARQEQEKTTAAGKRLTESLKAIGAAADLASGSTSGLTQILNDIEDVVAKSKAKEALEGLGLSAGLIEQVLTQPNWEAIFKRISRLAYLTSIDVSKVFSITALGQIGAEKAEIAEYLKTAFKTEEKGGGSAAEKPRDAVKELFDGLRDEVNKQAASLKLSAMGASQGLIDLILGDDDWSKLWQQIKTGLISLKDLQKQFSNTAAGVEETKEALKAAADEADAYIQKIQDTKDKLEQTFLDAQARAEDFKKSMAEISKIEVLPDIEAEVGRFEAQIISAIDSIQTRLEQALESDAITQAGFDKLRAWAQKEGELLQTVARQRDDLANRYKLSEALIAEYKSAFASAANLTSLFSTLKTETEKRTVTEITSSVAKLSGSLKEFNVTVTREYEETIDKVVSKSQGLLNGFRDMASKARGFAENLRKLKDMGLNGDLFNQLVQAGVEAGGETAQALVEGGADTVSEINSLFAEINTIGANLGEEVATTLYGTGIDMAKGLLEGIQSQQTALETLAKTMAKAFNDNFTANVNVQAAAPVATAQNAFNNVIVPIIDTEDLAKINGLIANATKIYNTSTNIAQLMGVSEKLDIFNLIKEKVLSGAQLDLSGIVAGLSTSELTNRAAALGVTNNITVNVTTDATQSNAMVGQTIANVINNYTGKGGALLSGVAL